MQQRWMLEQVEQTEDNGDDLDDLSYAPRGRQQPDQVEDKEKDCYQNEQGNYRHGTPLSGAA
jgi:hypothetical protein